MTERERIEKEVGIAEGDTWTSVLVAVLLWLEKKFSERAAPPRPGAKCDACGLVHHSSWIGYPCSNHPRCRGGVLPC